MTCLHTDLPLLAPYSTRLLPSNYACTVYQDQESFHAVSYYVALGVEWPSLSLFKLQPVSKLIEQELEYIIEETVQQRNERLARLKEIPLKIEGGTNFNMISVSY